MELYGSPDGGKTIVPVEAVLNSDGTTYSLSTQVNNASSITIGTVDIAPAQTIGLAAGTQSIGTVVVSVPGTAVAGFSNETGAEAHKQLIADPGASVTVHVTGLMVTNDNTAPITIVVTTDTGGANTSISPIYTVPVGGATQPAVLNLYFPQPGLLGTVHKNVGFTATGTSNYTVQLVGYAV